MIAIFQSIMLSLKETHNSSKIRPLDFEQKMIAQPRKTFCKIPMDTISVMLLCWFVYAEVLFDFEEWLENRWSSKFHKDHRKARAQLY